MLAVDRQHRNRGIGGALLTELISVARTAGYGEVTLHVRRDNEGARRLYERTGFAESRVVSRYYQPSGADALVMTLDISRGAAVP
jgi:ribosomal-protein-alanine N-acetyltransferase